MPITVKLQGMFSYSFWIIALVIAVVLLIGIVALILFLKAKKKPVEPVKPEPQPMPVPIPVAGEQLKNKYCKMIDELEQACRGGKVNNRKAYQKLSVILRRFVHDLTGVKVHNYTLEEIKRLNMPQLSDVIAECYTPEFSVDKEGEIYNTINKARMVIREWRS